MTRLMIIDDDDLLIKSLEIALERNGYEVISALSGSEGLKKLKTVKPDLIFLDIMMPLMDGWKTLQEIKGDENLAKIPVIMLTAKNQNSSFKTNKVELGFNDYLTKPFELDELNLRITKALDS